MNKACELCKGACCEGMRMKAVNFPDQDTEMWFKAHCVVHLGFFYIPAPCCHLQNGLCSIYPRRFECCEELKVGSQSCRWAIQNNRPKNAEEIIKLL